MRRGRTWVWLVPLALLVAGCSGEGSPAPEPEAATPSAEPSPPASSSQAPEAGRSLRPEPEPPAVRPRDFDQGQALAVVEHLAGTVGPRHGTSPGFARAATWTQGYLDRLGYDVRRQAFAVPGGDSWGVQVPAGRSVNVVATPPDFDATRPHLVVGAHLDTVPQAPGAEDNGSGVGVMLAAASAAAESTTRLPVVWVAFGAEEPRGPTDDDHHYGSQHYVAELPPVQRRAVRAMVSLDRVGVGATMPIGSAGDGDPVQQSLIEAAREADVAHVASYDSRSSDHWSFVRNGLPGARLGSTPYAGYHSPGDVADVIQPDQLGRAGRIVLRWLAPTGR